MPNTLAHIALQSIASRAVAPRADVKWLLLAAVLPDFPWILETLARPWWPDSHFAVLRLYTTVQASALYGVVMSAALALLSQRPRFVFLLLAGNVVVHLLLDAGLECKWGNGVHLIAPLSWNMVNVGLFWPESVPVLAISAAGLGMLGWMLLRRPGDPVDLTFRHGHRVAAAALLLLAYYTTPPLFRAATLAADVHGLATLGDGVVRPGRAIALDRVAIEVDHRGEAVALLDNGQTLDLAGAVPTDSGSRSLRGWFRDDGRLVIEASHPHTPWLRSWPTYIGLAAFAAVWVVALMPPLLRRRLRRRAETSASPLCAPPAAEATKDR